LIYYIDQPAFIPVATHMNITAAVTTATIFAFIFHLPWRRDHTMIQLAPHASVSQRRRSVSRRRLTATATETTKAAPRRAAFHMKDTEMEAAPVHLVVEAIGSGWPQVLGIFSAIWWLRKLDIRRAQPVTSSVLWWVSSGS
jgi:hypothetical protein